MEKDLSSFWTIIVNSSTPGNPEIYKVTIFGHKIYDCYIFTIPFINKYKHNINSCPTEFFFYLILPMSGGIIDIY